MAYILRAQYSGMLGAVYFREAMNMKFQAMWMKIYEQFRRTSAFNRRRSSATAKSYENSLNPQSSILIRDSFGGVTRGFRIPTAKNLFAIRLKPEIFLAHFQPDQQLIIHS